MLGETLLSLQWVEVCQWGGEGGVSDLGTAVSLNDHLDSVRQWASLLPVSCERVGEKDVVKEQRTESGIRFCEEGERALFFYRYLPACRKSSVWEKSQIGEQDYHLGKPWSDNYMCVCVWGVCTRACARIFVKTADKSNKWDPPTCIVPQERNQNSQALLPGFGQHSHRRGHSISRLQRWRLPGACAV